MLRIGHQYYEESGYQRYAPLDENSCRELVSLMLQAGIVFVAEQGCELVGMIGAVLAPFMFNSAINTASEVLFFVDKRATGNGVGGRLLDAMLAECKATGARFVQMHLLPRHESAGLLASLYRSRGLEESERSFSKVV